MRREIFRWTTIKRCGINTYSFHIDYDDNNNDDHDEDNDKDDDDNDNDDTFNTTF